MPRAVQIYEVVRSCCAPPPERLADPLSRPHRMRLPPVSHCNGALSYELGSSTGYTVSIRETAEILLRHMFVLPVLTNKDVWLRKINLLHFHYICTLILTVPIYNPVALPDHLLTVTLTRRRSLF